VDVPQSQDGRALADFMRIGSSIMRSGPATVRLGIAQSGRVQVNIYDVAGRKIRTLADRFFPAGELELRWDGSDDAGNKVGRGVYFVRSSVQKGTGRIIVLNR
jgi:flagellar hook assembly protein FlgD